MNSAFRRFAFCAALLAAAGAPSFLTHARGLVTNTAAVLYDSHSDKSNPLLILSKNHPVRRVSQVSGWLKVETEDGKAGWLRESEAAPLRACVVIAPQTAVRFDPSEAAGAVFVAQKGVVLEFLGNARAGWLQTAHQDGETGYAPAAALWCND